MLLQDRKPRPWPLPQGAKASFKPDGYYLGSGTKTPLEVAVAHSGSRPTESDVRTLWKKRRGATPSPLLLIVVWPSAAGDRASVCGTTGDDPAVYSDRDPDQLARLATLALTEPDHHAATRFLAAYLPEEGGGLRNVALFASHHLRERVPLRGDWKQLCADGASLLSLRREQLVEALGFSVEPKGQAALLRVKGHARALAVFLDDGENPDNTAARFNGITPVSWAIASAGADNIPYVVVARGPQIRVYTTRAGAGLAGKGGTGAFIELNLPLLTAEDAGYLPLLLSAESLMDGGPFEQLLEESNDFAIDLGTRLRSRVYDDAVPYLAQALINKHEGGDDPEALASLYNQTLLVLFRLMFVAYAEDRDLLPLRTNGLYRQRSLKHLARDLADGANKHGWDEVVFDENATDLWDNVRALWTAVDKGRKEWGVPPYNGGMFSTDPDVSPEGAGLASLTLSNADIGPALLGLLVDEINDDVYAPVDFASLDVREFGTIYEGLLESNLAVAPCDLAVGKDDSWKPAGPKDEVWVEEGAVYLHNKSGARKASGSYFTKPFAVNHLLDHALEAALDSHVERLRTLLSDEDELAASEAFFDFRCVDLSMGSGHFLVAAVDRIERRLSEFLTEYRLSGVLDELDRLSRKAAETLEDAGVVAEGVDTNTLLRRQIARRCIYGVDLNATSVELARLALWIHTFVRGLPLTSLNHGLIVGNSLTGIGTLDEAVEVLDPDSKKGRSSFVRLAIQDALEEARTALSRFAATGEADAAEVREARKAHREAEKAVEPARLLLDYAIAIRTGELPVPTLAFDAESLLTAARSGQASEAVAKLSPTHFPVAFPEVFLRDRPGFDCILGNPPWEKVKVEEHNFWSLRHPGLRALPVGERREATRALAESRPDLVAEYEHEVAVAQTLKQVLFKGPYPGISSGDPDLYKAFAWRFWHLVRDGGAIGVVLPRSALAATGTAAWREAVLAGGTFAEVTMTVNTGGWVFDDAEPRYTIGFVSIRRSAIPGRIISMRGPYASRADYELGLQSPPVEFPVEDFVTWTNGAAFPLLPTDRAGGVFLKLREHPRLDAPLGWRARPVRELHASDDRDLYHSEREPADWPVYKGESFELWNPDTGTHLGWADPGEVLPAIQEKRVRQQRLARSAFAEFPSDWAASSATLPCLRARITFRDIARATDTRTVIPVLAPPEVFLTHLDPYILWPSGDERDEAYLLGVLCSIPLDWYARRIVENHVSYQLLNAFPIPRAERDDRLRLRVEQITGRLAAVDDRYSAWAESVGVPVASVPESERDALTAELDAAVALLYGLSEDDVRTVFETFHEGWHYDTRLAAVLAAMHELTGDAK